MARKTSSASAERHRGVSGETLRLQWTHRDFSEEPEISRLRRIRCGRDWRDMPVPVKISRRRRTAGDITTSAESRRHQDIAETSRYRGDIETSRRHRDIAETSRYRGDIAETSRYRGDSLVRGQEVRQQIKDKFDTPEVTLPESSAEVFG